MFGIWGEYYWYRIKKGIKKIILPAIVSGFFILILVLGIPYIKTFLEEAQTKKPPMAQITSEEKTPPKKPELTEEPSTQEQLLPSKPSLLEQRTPEKPPVQEQPQKIQPSYPEFSVNEISLALYEGDYDRALDLIKRALDKNPYEQTFKTLYSQLMDELKVDFKFSYLPGRRKILETRTSSNLVLTSSDPYYLRVHASDTCHLYIFQITSSGDLKQLFPSARVSTSNPIPPGPLRIPDGADWFYLDNIPGIETIYLIATRWRHEAIEELLAKIKAEREKEIRKDLIEKVISRAELEDKATERVPGLVFGMLQFSHVSAKHKD